MSKDVFKERESALEYEFFHKVDEELMKKLKAKLDFEKQEHALADATGIQDEAVLEELIELGISSETIFALSLFPLVWVAWADGEVVEKERQAILDAAHSTGHHRDTASHQLIDAWLDHKPGEKLLTAWKDYIHAVCKTISAEAKAIVKHDVLDRARNVAEAAGGILGFHKVSDAEQAVLTEIASTFDAD